LIAACWVGETTGWARCGWPAWSSTVWASGNSATAARSPAPAAEALPIVRPSRRRVWQRLGIEQFLRLRTMGGQDW